MRVASDPAANDNGASNGAARARVTIPATHTRGVQVTGLKLKVKEQKEEGGPWPAGGRLISQATEIGMRAGRWYDGTADKSATREGKRKAGVVPSGR